MEQLESLIGQEVWLSPWFTVDQDRIDAFADTTLDHQWIHVDASKSAQGPFGETIAHGYLTLSLITHLNSGIEWPLPHRMGINYGLDRVRFITPVPVGSSIRARTKLLEAREIDGGVHLKNEVTIELKGSDRPACVAESLSRLYF